MKSKATSFDIAHLAGVSQSTVSRALRNSPLVNPETRERIKAIAKQLNYKVDKNASNLRSQQSHTIALLLFEDPTSDESQINPFFLSMLGSITRTCGDNGYDLLVSFQRLEEDWHAEYEDTHKADGIILLGYGDYNDYQEKLQQLEQNQTRYVLWGALQQDQPGVSIACDNFTGGYDITQHLIRLGRQKIAFIGGASEGSPEFFDRYKGSCQAQQDAQLPVRRSLQVDAITTEQSGYAAALQLLAKQQPFDAIVCASDLIAVGVIKALRDKGFKVPQDVAVVGYDNIPLSEFTRPALTTVQQDTKLAGKMLVETLLALIAGKPASSRSLPAKLIVRESCGQAL
ncbi:MAG: LacI family DNA-binding transcriptional regulator [Gammaproteobacteria bacterium]|nr:LacI family DNA-binding transcriptional regulator [Gammaproteobacteria bacterium]NVK87361.1 LacI family DNA-binding transcriptional regulator [Gammaproteobacteria bacterium]